MRTFLLILFTSVSLPTTWAADGMDQKIKEATLIQKDKPAPDFTCRTTDGRNVTLSELKGKVVVIYFFSMSNQTSLTEMKYLEKEVFQRLRERGDFQMIAVGRDHGREELVRLSGDMRYSFPMVPDAHREIFHRYFTSFVPRTVVVRKNGTVGYLATGYHEFDGIVKVQAILAKELAAPAP